MRFVSPESAEKWVNYHSFCCGDFSISNRKTMATPKTSHTAACDLPAPSPGQPNPSTRLWKRRVRFSLQQLARKWVKYPTFWGGGFYQDGPFANSSPLQSIPPPLHRQILLITM